MKLVHKVALSFSIVIAIIIVLTVTVIYGLSINQKNIESIDRTYIALDQLSNTRQLLLVMETNKRGFVLTGYEDLLEPIEQGRAAMDETLDKLRDSPVLTSEMTELVQSIDDFYRGWLTVALLPPLKLAKSGQVDEAIDFISEARGQIMVEELHLLFAQLRRLKEHSINEQQSLSKQQSSLTQVVMLVGGVGVVLIALVAAYMVNRQLNLRLSYAIDIASGIAKGHLNQPIDLSAQDEVKHLLAAMQSMQSHLRAMFSHIERASNELNELSQIMADTAGQLGSESTQQVDNANSMTSSIDKLNTNIQHVTAQAKDAETIAISAGSETEASALIVERSTRSMQLIAERVNTVAQEMEGLGDKSEAIGDIVGTIKSIADQTNLLSLNAAIEAARAGEQGRGFSVVADEVRSLAKRTSESTQEIENMINQIQNNIEETVQQMNLSVNEVNEGADLGQQTSQAMTTMRTNFSEVVSRVQVISEALNLQSQVSNQVAGTVTQVAEGADKTLRVTGDSQRIAGSLNKVARQLDASIAEFKLD